MATPSPSSSGRSMLAMYKRLVSNKPLYIAFIFALTAGAIVLMTVPALTLSDPPKESVLDLSTTFSTLVSLLNGVFSFFTSYFLFIHSFPSLNVFTWFANLHALSFSFLYYSLERDGFLWPSFSLASFSWCLIWSGKPALFSLLPLYKV